ncbi:TetR/AcrR family transcriptional regulator [Sinorhizobium prairiense]|uniref:TetR/AcrR family transcriptional regulator n=1 Tax=unclassified Sinorhizobium TaxID=2613772 RepID=UPI0023D88046|nr:MULTISPECIES: helix-turn-helix domain containing protein [unclassified Sinorhizobium]WEJ12169.1 TetR/AcrR family transcriptional regulator [Sinorhizobium sp. M103]WEJ17426.1 TetR/AcrR family transcriptional regulator [Sinorhizobium sp. K101]WEJ40616.1 TetR/AcrR family transcriptional regulator [Sinorhizobium sp. C101]
MEHLSLSTTRAYNSPLREERARETHDAILAALLSLMQSSALPDDISMEAIAAEAGVQRRTIFRHFASKDDLLFEFWPWFNARIGVSIKPETLRDIVSGPPRAFPLFDEHEAAMRAALHSRTGRRMRLGTVSARRKYFSGALAPVLSALPPERARKVEALAHLLYSASAWEVLKDYGGLDGTQAGETASWALELILSAVGSGESPADATIAAKGDTR